MARSSVKTEIARRLEAAADPKTREWWERYLRGAIPFYGVPMAKIRAIVHDVHRERSFDVDTALGLFAGRRSEEKLAGVLALSELLLDEVEVADLERPWPHIADWSTCDWYCVKVLGRWVERDPKPRSEAIAAWRDADSVWQRRAVAVAFVNHAPKGDAFYRGFVRLLLTVCEANARDRTRWSQTSVGWLLRELSKAEPERVRRFVETHDLSAEARRAATAKLRR